MSNKPVQLLHKLVSLDTSKPDRTTFLEAFDLIKTSTEDLPIVWHMPKTTHSTTPLLVGSAKKARPNQRVILSGHIDTIYPPQDVLNKQTKKKLYGSGTQDMKAGIVVLLEAARNAIESFDQYDITIVISTDEENGPLNNNRTFLETLGTTHTAALVYESTLDSELDAPHNKRSVVVSRNAFLLGNLKVNGPGGHSGVITEQDTRVSSINALARFITLLEEKIDDYSIKTLSNPGIISGGDAFNVLAPNAELIFEIRYSQKQERTRIQKELDTINKYIQSNYGVESLLTIEIEFPGLHINKNTLEYKQSLSTIGNQLGLDIVFEHRGGGSEANFLSAKNSDMLVIDGMGPRGGGQHTTEEFVFLESIQQSIDYSTEVLRHFFQK